MPEATSCMREAHWVKLLPSRSTVVDPAKAKTPVMVGVLPSENLPLGHSSPNHLILRPRMGPRRG